MDVLESTSAVIRFNSLTLGLLLIPAVFRSINGVDSITGSDASGVVDVAALFSTGVGFFSPSYHKEA
eukprot:13111830-Ditylum_brightwellii.AAC.1